MVHTFKDHLLIRILILLCLVIVLPRGPALAASGDTTRVSVSSAGAQANGASRRSMISGDGNYVAFSSEASNLVSGDSNGITDIFVHNRQTGATERISVADNESQANNWSEDRPAISTDGRYVAFVSMASNLVSNDTNGITDVFVRDRQLGTTRRVSVSSSGTQASGDEGTHFGGIALSSDGRFVVFTSDASNLVSNDTNGIEDVFVHDLLTGETSRVSISSSGEQANDYSASGDISADGRLIVFVSHATNLVAGDTNGQTDVFLHNQITGETRRVSVSSSGEQTDKGNGSPVISEDGRYVAFSSAAENIAPDFMYGSSIYTHDLATGETRRISVYPDGSSLVGTAMAPSISADGRYVAFEFDDRGDGISEWWIYVHDRVTGQLVSATENGITEDDRAPYGPSLSGDGRFLAFQSGVQTLIDDDTNGVIDVFVREDPTYVDPAPSVISFARADPNPTSAASVRFTLIFSEAVTGVDASDFQIEIRSPVTYVMITDISGSGTTYTITVDTGTGSGNLALSLINDNSIVDARLQPLTGNFMSEEYTIVKNAPRVTDISCNDPSPTYISRTVRFQVSFSQGVTGVDITDFKLIKSGATSAAITGVSGSGSNYNVTINTGNTKNTLRLDLIDNDTIRNAFNQPLGGVGTGNGNFTGESYKVVVLETSLFRSNGTNDGWVLESGEDTNLGGSLNAAATTFYLGDNAQNRQFRAFLHFPTSTLPDNAVIVSATIKIKKLSVTGTDPFTTHQDVLVDIRTGAFSGSNALQIGDFQAAANREAVGIISSPPSGVWYSTVLDTRAFPCINRLGITQFRLAFQLDDNNDLGADTMKFYSGNYGDLAYRPQLQVQYYVP